MILQQTSVDLVLSLMHGDESTSQYLTCTRFIIDAFFFVSCTSYLYLSYLSHGPLLGTFYCLLCRSLKDVSLANMVQNTLGKIVLFVCRETVAFSIEDIVGNLYVEMLPKLEPYLLTCESTNIEKLQNRILPCNNESMPSHRLLDPAQENSSLAKGANMYGVSIILGTVEDIIKWFALYVAIPVKATLEHLVLIGIRIHLLLRIDSKYYSPLSLRLR